MDLVTTPANIVSNAIADQVKKMHSTLHIVTRSQSMDQLISNPGPDFILALDDSVGVIGKRDQLDQFCKLSNSLGCETT